MRYLAIALMGLAGFWLPGQPLSALQGGASAQGVGGPDTPTDAATRLGAWEQHLQMERESPVHDLVVHPREGEIVIGTHGRSIWVADLAAVREWGKPETTRAPTPPSGLNARPPGVCQGGLGGSADPGGVCIVMAAAGLEPATPSM